MNSISSFSKGGALSKEDLEPNGDIKCILYGDLYTKYLNNIKCVISRIKNQNDIKFGRKGDILLPLSGETPLDISNSAVLPEENIALGSDLLVISTQLNSLFLSFQLSGVRKKDIARLAQGKSIVHINPKEISKLKVYFPELKEQKYISDFLTILTDKIDLTREKINALKKYKEGICRNILNTRISSKTQSLNNYCKIRTGKLDANAMKPNGKYKFFTCSKVDYLIDDYAFDCEAILVAGNGEVGHTKYYKGKFNAYQRTYVLYDFKVDPILLKTCIDLQITSVIKKETNKGAMPYIKLGTFNKIKIPELDKSKKDALKIIKSFDKKIDWLEKSLNQFELIKQYLLRNLFI